MKELLATILRAIADKLHKVEPPQVINPHGEAPKPRKKDYATF